MEKEFLTLLFFFFFKFCTLLLKVVEREKRRELVKWFYSMHRSKDQMT